MKNYAAVVCAGALLLGWPSVAFAQILPDVATGPVRPGPILLPPGPQSQYAVKFVCGKADLNFSSFTYLVGTGFYLTAINIHNPTNERVEYRFKTAQAGLAADGLISPFTYGTTGPDGAQVFRCWHHIATTASSQAVVDGFFVIESRLPLDVTAVYTASNVADNSAPSIHVDKIDARAVSSLCQQNLEIDLSLPQMWARANGGHASQVPAANAPLWDQNRTWMSYVPSGNAATNKSYTYQFDFCSCSSEGGAVNGDVKSDASSGGVFNRPIPVGMPVPLGSPIFTVGPPGNFNFSDLEVPISQTFAGGGNGSILATVQNPGNPTGISLRGNLSLYYGHAGRCR